MLKPAGIPRTLVGLGGVRLISMPGIKYPENVLKAVHGMHPETGEPYPEPPVGSIPTREAAMMLNCCPTVARITMRQNDVPHYYVSSEKYRKCIYWQLEGVLNLVKNRPGIFKMIPRQLLTAEEAIRILKVSRSTLYRYVRRSRLREFRYRIMTVRGYRHQCLFLRSEILQLAAWRRAAQSQYVSWKSYRLHQLENNLGTEAEQVEI